MAFAPLAAIALSSLTCQMLSAQTLAFPGAEGFGAYAEGGRGGDVYRVTNLNDSGPGSLRQGISSASGPRTIVFAVSGLIQLESRLSINRDHMTIAGQTAPGDGICVRDYDLSISADHVIVRFIRSRLGDDGGQESDAISITRGNHIIMDHCSASWSVDEVFSCSTGDPDTIDNVTVQWCIISEGLGDSIHSKGYHSYGALIRGCHGASYSYHHNLFAHNNGRNPRPGNYNQNDYISDPLGLRFDFRNNVIYNWGGDHPSYDADSDSVCRMNYVGNYCKAGPSSSYGELYDTGSPHFMGYYDGNYWNGGIPSDPYSIVFFGSWSIGQIDNWIQSDPFSTGPIATQAAQDAYISVLANVGASLARDSIDERIVNEVLAGTVTYYGSVSGKAGIIDDESDVGGWPVYNSTIAPPDSDLDGVPDYWESALGWDPGVPNNNHVNPDGYTDLEWYLNWLADPHSVCNRNGEVFVNLRDLNGGTSNLTFTVTHGTNGVVALLGDGDTAHFIPLADFSGLADFTFNANDPVNGGGFGPVSIVVLVTTNEALHVPSVTITNPAAGSILVGGIEVLLAADVTDGAGAVTNVQFYAGDSEPLPLIGEDQTAPYSEPWIPPSASGAYTIRAVAEDDSGWNATNSITVTVNPPIQSVSTAMGNGADIELRERSDGGTTNFVQSVTNNDELNTRWAGNDPGDNRNDVVGLRFDLSGRTLADLTNVTLNFVNYRDNSSRIIDIYGVPHGTLSGTGTYDTETWDEVNLVSAQLFGNLPGLLASDGDPRTRSLDTTNLVLLVDGASVGDKAEGTVDSVGGVALDAFVQGYAGSSSITFLIAAGNESTGQYRFASKEASQTSSGGLSGSVGDFAPYLEFTTSSPAVPALTYMIAGEDTGIDFSWDGAGFKLQSQTNALGTGLNTNWFDYPGGETSPVSVPITATNGAVFFRLAQ